MYALAIFGALFFGALGVAALIYLFILASEFNH